MGGISMSCLGPRPRVGGVSEVLSQLQSRASTATERSRGGWLTVLCLTLLGYASFGKGWAYLGIPPLYIGELVLLCGVASLVMSGRWAGIFNVLPFWFLLAFMAWGASRTWPYHSRYGADALRDAVIWGYGAFAIVVFGHILAQPSRLALLLRRYSQFAQIFPVIAPVIWLGCRLFRAKTPHWPWAANVYIIEPR